MKLKDFSALCFDMDFTLVNYSVKKFLPMVYDVTAQFLVEKKGYPKTLQHRDDSDVSLFNQFLACIFFCIYTFQQCDQKLIPNVQLRSEAVSCLKDKTSTVLFKEVNILQKSDLI